MPISAVKMTKEDDYGISNYVPWGGETESTWYVSTICPIVPALNDG
jgi:hypothetical protein